MKKFLDEDFLLQSKTAQRLYHEFAFPLPVIDYHSHIPAAQIADDVNFKNLTQVWLYGDHYKWRAMRTNGVDERYCTGDKNDFEKFEQWAATVPFTLRNPLYHWTHLELKRYFDIDEILSTATARKIYDTCTEKLQSPEFSARNLLRKMKVEIAGTTDDPVDSLFDHRKLHSDGFEVKVIPCFRPDKAMEVNDVNTFNGYVNKLGDAVGKRLGSYHEYIMALKDRHNYFAEMGCSVSDHGVEQLFCEEYSEEEIVKAFDTLRIGQNITRSEQSKFKSALLHQFGKWDHEKNWVQQFHLGAMRNNNTLAIHETGADAGWDSIGDYEQGKSTSVFLNHLHSTNQLAKTILYNSNPRDNELMATMVGNFNDGSFPGKIQWGPAWWFLDQKDGMTNQLNILSGMGLLSRFVGMVTDSRSFLSYPRHEYFRRILCNLFGEEIEAGELPNDITWTGKIIQDICYYNAKKYFDW